VKKTIEHTSAATGLAKPSAKPVKGAAVRKPAKDCSERVRLEREHVVAFTEWINAGGEGRKNAKDPAVVAATAKLSSALKAMVDHRKKHDC